MAYSQRLSLHLIWFDEFDGMGVGRRPDPNWQATDQDPAETFNFRSMEHIQHPPHKAAANPTSII